MNTLDNDNATLDRPVFIVGLHRTGSTLLKNILDRSSVLAMATDEMDVSNPWKHTFEDDMRRFRNAANEAEFRELVEFIYSGRIHSTFWSEYPLQGIPREAILKRLKKDLATVPGVMRILLDEYRLKKGKQRVGVKYPLHVSRLDRLCQWFPDCRAILLTRDIRAICTSKLNDEATVRRKSRGWFAGLVVHYVTLLLFLFDYVWSARVYLQNRMRNNLTLIRYEDLVACPEETVRSLCEFCKIPFEKGMLDATGKPSSISTRPQEGIDRSRASHWKSRLGRVDKWLVRLIAGRSMKVFGYF
ncbi:MAG: sulfotransferase [Thermoguttaceae bacterium]|nr:sulfotransferase [Thermoguttaceae bacterium]